ncbi:SMI1/KNR4 family protein [Streptomyces sp. NPDC002730]|uniref:SMI1/KNR4 family protein n=1 Tax=Streptomyces sp. NPDC002730 TaxID=3364662 RepID=UPI00368DBCA4
MAVEIPADIQELCKELGKGVEYALKVLCRQLEDNPLLGSPTGDRYLYVAEIDGDTFEDCPALHVHYAYGPPLLVEGQVQIRDIAGAQLPASGTGTDAHDRDQAPDPHLEEIAARQVTGAWQRIETWLHAHAPASYASLKAGASEGEIAALEEALGVRIPADLKALWSLHSGVHNVHGARFLMENWALMDLDSVVSFYQQQMRSQQRDGDDEFTFWTVSWIPVCSFGADDRTYGLYLDAETGQLCYWDRYGERRPEYASLTTYLEEMADALEAPSLVTGARPGLADGGLAWGPPTDPDIEAAWVPFAG